MSAATSTLHPKQRDRIPPFVQSVESPESALTIWITHFDSISSDEMIALETLLDSREQARAAQFRFDRDRRCFIASRGIIRNLLGVALDIPAAELGFEYGAHGKPSIDAIDADGRKLRFNVSHAAGSAMFALAWDREVGIDLEAATRLTDKNEKLPVRILSPRELVIWRAIPNEKVRDPALLRAWTRKEAFIKATGEGLFHELRDIEVALDAAAPQPSLRIRGASETGKTSRNWTIYDLSAPSGFAAAAAVEQIGS